MAQLYLDNNFKFSTQKTALSQIFNLLYMLEPLVNFCDLCTKRHVYFRNKEITI